jgi:hypothetical protein
MYLFDLKIKRTKFLAQTDAWRDPLMRRIGAMRHEVAPIRGGHRIVTSPTTAAGGSGERAMEIIGARGGEPVEAQESVAARAD